MVILNFELREKKQSDSSEEQAIYILTYEIQ